MIDLLPDAPDPANDIPSVFSQKAAAMVLAQKTMVSQINAAIASLNSIGAGGAFAIPYRIWGVGGPTTAGNLVWGTPTTLQFALTDSRGADVSGVLANAFASTSSVKAYVLASLPNDPSTWVLFAVTGYSVSGTIGTATMYAVANHGSPPSGADVVVQIARTGDKGDNGSSQLMLLREYVASGTTGQNLTASSWNQRTLNTVSWNGITGASLGAGGANTFRLPVGLYVILASAPAYTSASSVTLRHQIRLFNRTGGAMYDIGGPEVVSNGSTGYATSRSVMRTVLQLASPTDFSIDHYVGISATGGLGGLSGSGEIHTEVMIMKVG